MLFVIMTLTLLPILEVDFSIMTAHALMYPIGDDLIAPPVPLCWPVTSMRQAQNRLNFHVFRQRQRFLNDRSVRFMKVVDNTDGSIISVARWHYYPTGFSYERDGHWEPAPDNIGDEDGLMDLNIPLHNHILSTRDAARASWQGDGGSPCWILMHTVTRPSQRGRGAAGLLIEWGILQAKTQGVPAYLEAGVKGRPIYEKYGFRQVGELLKVDLSAHGGVGEFEMTKMAFFPLDE